MKAAPAVLAAAALLTPAAARPPMRYQPDPSSVFAAEIAFNRLAQQKGQWTAFRETAAEDAVMFVPQRVLARQWLKRQGNPPRSVTWSPSIIHVSCDGNLAASTGNRTNADGSAGYFTRIWRRDKYGAWKWILSHDDNLARPREAPEFLTGRVASCKRRPPGDGHPASSASTPVKGSTPVPVDDSLLWNADTADGSRRIIVRAWNGSAYDIVIDDKAGAPGA